MIEIIKKNKIIIGIVFIIIFFLGMHLYSSNSEYDEMNENEEILIQENNVNDNEVEKIVVHIAGAIKNPGIVKLELGSRISDAIDEAGGLTEEANIENINLAHILEDGEKIKIPKVGDETIIEEESKDNMVNINTATQSELQTLDGIGPSLALRIIEYRKENGKFKKIEDIKNVSGIGENKYESIKNKIKI